MKKFLFLRGYVYDTSTVTYRPQLNGNLLYSIDPYLTRRLHEIDQEMITTSQTIELNEESENDVF